MSLFYNFLAAENHDFTPKIIGFIRVFPKRLVFSRDREAALDFNSHPKN